ncbi:hypothetical protein JKP88DRAFT_279899 [Tribonema minus]|uniref:Uncharacterized protein n=1 Tax=Tribonema minus TaxID=303371 RepID=A0A835YUA5_9STRA|nr:hypothetical protein JKP88DRAFT_279899 [Tribonema minus]
MTATLPLLQPPLLVIAAAVLAGELSLMAALASIQLVRAHNRKKHPHAPVTCARAISKFCASAAVATSPSLYGLTNTPHWSRYGCSSAVDAAMWPLWTTPMDAHGVALHELVLM